MNKIFLGIISCILFLASCQKKTDPVDGSNATVTLISAGTSHVINNVTVNPGDSIFFKFSISSPENMKYVSMQKNPVNQIAFLKRDTLAGQYGTTSHTTEMRFKADTTNGSYVYRIVAHNSVGKYIGHKDVVVTVKTDYTYYTYRFLQNPDSTAKTNTHYMSATTGNMYSYSNGSSASANIDFGMFYDTTGTAAGTPAAYTLYALSAAPVQMNSLYDISSWTKNITIMKKISSPTFASLQSGGGIRAACATLSSGTTNKITQLAAGNIVAFKTSTGKQGVLVVNFINGNGTQSSNYLNVDVKIEK